MREPGAAELAELACLLQERIGLLLRPDTHAALRIAWLARFEDLRPPPVPPAGYVEHLRSPAGEEELRRLLPLVTVGKTHFFRDEAQFTALAALLPGLLAAARERGSPLAIWSAGCATGEEPWSIAMLAAEAGARPEELELLATDVNPEAVAAARQGRYPARRAAEVPGPLRERWLTARGDDLEVGPRLRPFLGDVRAHNLVSKEWPQPRAGAWDLVFCRNVIIYFDTPTTQGVLGRFLSGLAPGGWLFLGYSESLFRMFEGFELAQVERAFLYRRPPASGAPPPDPSLPVRTPPPVPPPGLRYAPGAVRHQAAGHAGAAAPALSFSPQEVLDAVVQLCGAGRFAEARERLERQLAAGPTDLAIRLTLANLLVILREPGKAGEAFAAALAQEPLSAEAHLFLGLHLLGLGRHEEAARELGRALFLDPDLAMGHYFLGRCREVQGDAERAGRSYQNAIDAHARVPAGRSHPFAGFYPDLPEDGAPFARAAGYALAVLRSRTWPTGSAS